MGQLIDALGPVFGAFKIICIALGSAFSVGLVLNRLFYRQSVKRLTGLMELLEDATLAVDDALLLRSLVDTSLDAKLDGRPVRLTFFSRRAHKSSNLYLLHRLDVTHPVGSFEISRVGLLRRAGRFLGLVKDATTGDESVDDKYVLSGHEGNLTELFRNPELGRAVHAVFEDGMKSVRLENDELFAERKIDAVPQPDALHDTLRLLAHLASFCERRAVNVQFLGPRPRFAWLGGSQVARCPYCHDDLNLSEGVTACNQCDTLHHVACLAEAQGCTVLGCANQVAGPPRSRKV